MYSQGFAKNLDSNVKSKLALLTKQNHHDFISKNQKKKQKKVSKLSIIPNFPNFPQLSNETNTKQNSHHYQQIQSQPIHPPPSDLTLSQSTSTVTKLPKPRLKI